MCLLYTQYSTPGHQMCVGYSPHQAVLQRHLGVLPFSSVLTLSTWRDTLHHSASGILVPPPGIEPVPPALEARSLDHQGSPSKVGCYDSHLK